MLHRSIRYPKEFLKKSWSKKENGSTVAAGQVCFFLLESMIQTLPNDVSGAQPNSHFGPRSLRKKTGPGVLPHRSHSTLSAGQVINILDVFQYTFKINLQILDLPAMDIEHPTMHFRITVFQIV